MSEKLPQGNQESLVDDNGWGTSAAEANRKAWESDLQEDTTDAEQGFGPSAAENNRKAWENEAQNSTETEESEASSDEENYDVNTWEGFKSDRREATELGITTKAEYDEWRAQKYPQEEEKVNQAERFKDKKSWRDFEDEGGTNGQEYKDWLEYKKATDPINVMKKLKELESNYDEQKLNGTKGGFLNAKSELYRFKTENGEIIEAYNQKQAEKEAEKAEAEKAAAEKEAMEELARTLKKLENEKSKNKNPEDDSDKDKDSKDTKDHDNDFVDVDESEFAKIDAAVDSESTEEYESIGKTQKKLDNALAKDIDSNSGELFIDGNSRDIKSMAGSLALINRNKLDAKADLLVGNTEWREGDEAFDTWHKLESNYDFIQDQADIDSSLRWIELQANNLTVENVESEVFEQINDHTPDVADKIKAAQLEKAKLFQAERTAQQESHDHSNEKVSWGFWKKTKEFVTGSHKRKQKKLDKAILSAKEARTNFKSKDLDKFNLAVQQTGYKKQQKLYDSLKQYL